MLITVHIFHYYVVLSETVLANVTGTLHALQVLEVVVPVADGSLRPQVNIIHIL